MAFKTKFDNVEVEILTKYFNYYCDGNQMDETVFKDRIHRILNINSEVMLERIFRVFESEGNNNVSLDEWLKGLSIILRGNLNEISRYCFSVYDLKSDGHITKSDIIYLLKDSLVQVEDNEDPEEELKNLAKITIKNMDFDQDGRLSFQDFLHAVSQNISLLEAFGHCLPHDDIDINAIVDFDM
ncbi:EF-hand calcium-binding domain-containing protein 1 [Chamberlinius hualienensis]